MSVREAEAKEVLQKSDLGRPWYGTATADAMSAPYCNFHMAFGVYASCRSAAMNV